VEIVSDPRAKSPDRAEARRLVNVLLERRVLSSEGHVLKIRPPLVFSRSDVDWFCSALREALD
jgi:4-aminobutyrate aminotransferase-like enzyme